MKRDCFEDIVRYCLKTIEEYLKDALKNLEEIIDIDPDEFAVKEEFGIQSRYIFRGFYCPSPVMEHFIVNMRRGKIAQRTPRKPTNRYLFDKNDNLYYAETFYQNGSVESEYIFYKDNAAYGISLGEWKDFNNPSQLTISMYHNGRIVSYLWCCLSRYKDDISERLKHANILYETYDYNDQQMDARQYSILSLGDLERNHHIRCYRQTFKLDANNSIVPDSAIWGDIESAIVSLNPNA